MQAFHPNPPRFILIIRTSRVTDLKYSKQYSIPLTGEVHRSTAILVTFNMDSAPRWYYRFSRGNFSFRFIQFSERSRTRTSINTIFSVIKTTCMRSRNVGSTFAIHTLTRRYNATGGAHTAKMCIKVTNLHRKSSERSCETIPRFQQSMFCKIKWY